MHGLYPLTITVGSREFVLAAHSTEEKYKWMEVSLLFVDVSCQFTNAMISLTLSLLQSYQY